ncbi:MAG: DUF6326 family protein [Promethearchaeota archaeon]
MKKTLSLLWVARMLTGIQGDVIRIMDPNMLEDIIAGTTAVPMTEEILAAMAALMLLPIFMVFLSLKLPYKANRWGNIIVAIAFIVIDGVGFIIPRPLYENIMGIGYVVFCALIVWYAWNWTIQED